MKFTSMLAEDDDIATLRAKYLTNKAVKDKLAAKRDQYQQDLYSTRHRLKTTSGDYIGSKYLQPDDNRYEKVFDSILNKFDAGTLLVDFATDPSDKTKIKLEVEFRGDCIWLLGRNARYKPGVKPSNENGPVQKFGSVKEFIRSLTDSVYEVNQGVDRAAVRNNLFDPESFDRVVRQIIEFAQEYPDKTRSLAHEEGQWDVEIKFRRSLRRLSGAMFPNDVSSRFVIYPAISGENKWGRIVAPDEKEKYDPSLWESLLRELK